MLKDATTSVAKDVKLCTASASQIVKMRNGVKALSPLSLYVAG